MSHNDITGGAIRTKPSKAYAENYDAIFRKTANRMVTPMEGCKYLADKVNEAIATDKENGTSD